MTPEIYFEAFTLGNYNDFLDDPSCVRKAFNAAVSASHLADCYFEYHKSNTPDLVENYVNIGDFIAEISHATNNYFKDIRRIADAYKHLYTVPRSNSSDMSSTGAIESIKFEDEEINQLRTEEPLNNNVSVSNVVYTRKSGKILVFQEAITEVIKFWETKLYNGT